MDYDSIDIKDLPSILKNILPPNTIVKKYTTKSLIDPGENYGSILCSVTVKMLELLTNATSELHLVAKMCPKDEWSKSVFNTKITFEREIAVYRTISPILIKFQRQQGMIDTLSCLAQYYGSRINLNPDSDVVDEDNAILLLQNLKFSNFEVVDRLKGFDVDTAKLILRDLAILHAIPIALKLLEPDIFNKEILRHLRPWRLNDALFVDMQKLLTHRLIEIAKQNEECIPLISKVQKAITYSIEYYDSCAAPNEPFGTFVHNDLWVNNIMIKFVNQASVACKFLDFQRIEYGSIGQDIIFFLYTSIQPEVLNAHFEEFINHYYNVFITTLQDLKCDVSIFTYELFLQEIEKCAKIEVFHVLVLLQFVFAPKGKKVDIFELVEPKNLNLESDLFAKRVIQMILDFHRKNWI